jgi:peptidoglycan/LPS O-acetylase OafA/YrhL
MTGDLGPRRHVNLHRLPAWMQYGIAVVVVVIVCGLALAFSSDDGAPSWLTETAPPVLGILAIVIALGLLAGRLRRQR